MSTGWKAFELRMARDLGTERIPVTGERAGSDASTDKVCLQLKLRKALPKWIFEWMDGICGTAKKAGKSGVVVIKVPRMLDDDALAIMRWADFVKLHGAPECCRPQDLYPSEANGDILICKRCRSRWSHEYFTDAAGDTDTRFVRLLD